MHEQTTNTAQHILEEVFGFETFRPGQESIVNALLERKNVLVVMPTGSGKSLCFQIPALANGGLTVVVSPLIALMKDQVNALRLAGVAADSINSANEDSENVAAWRRAASGDCRLLYMAPERLMTERMLTALKRLPISMFVVDEAHCISQWGPSFRREYEDLSRLQDLFPGVPIAALTATADQVTRSDIAQRLFNGNVEQFVLGFDRPNIHLVVEIKRGWKQQLIKFISNHEGESGIVYCLSRQKTEDIAAMLSAEGVRAYPYHAGMEKEQREAHQNIFMTERGIVIVATIAFGMGIDKADVRFVFHTDIPGSIEAYYQEIGRAGRDGEAAVAHMLYGMADIRMRRLFIDQEGAGEDRKRREHKRFDALLAYCEAPTCRRITLLDHFGDEIEPCGNCDVCLNPVERINGTEAARKVLSAVYRTGQRFGAAHIVNVLRGSATEKVKQFDHHQLPTFGVGKSIDKLEWNSIIRQMVAAGYLQIDIAGYGGLKNSGDWRNLLRGECEFHYRKDTLSNLSRPSRRRSESGATTSSLLLTASQSRLLDDLKRLRLEIARERGVPAYIIFRDSALLSMVHKMPISKNEFATVHGVGAAKLEQFSDKFLPIIRNYLSTPE